MANAPKACFVVCVEDSRADDGGPAAAASNQAIIYDGVRLCAGRAVQSGLAFLSGSCRDLRLLFLV